MGSAPESTLGRPTDCRREAGITGRKKLPLPLLGMRHVLALLVACHIIELVCVGTLMYIVGL